MNTPTKRTLGEELVARGHLTAKHLEEALAEQRRTGRKLGQVLIDNNYVTEEQMTAVLAAQQGLPFIDLRTFGLQPMVARLIGEPQARKYRALVLEDRKDTYLVGVADPYNLAAQDALAAILKRPLDIAVVSGDVLNAVIERVFTRNEDINKFAREVESDLERNTSSLNLNQITASLDNTDAPVVKLLQTIFREAMQLRASDIHIEPQERNLVVRYRIDGVLHIQAKADTKIGPPLLVKLKLMAELDIAEKRIPQDGRISLNTDSGDVDIRLSTIPTQYGESAVMRLLMQSGAAKSLDKVGLPPDLYARFVKAVKQPNGIVLSTGPTGSGKTTTLYGALGLLNHPDVKILTAEDPVEYRIGGINQVQIHEKIGLTFPSVLRAFLRQDPDVMLVGEIRDNETAEIAIRAAMTGHMVLSTLHTNDAVSSPARLMDMGIPGFMIASSLRAVLSQRLLRLNCTHCAEPDELHADDVKVFDRFADGVPLQATIKRGKGCSHCKNSGYLGRTGVFEMLEMTHDLAAALHTENPVEFEAVAREQIGRSSMIRHALALVADGKTTVDEVLRNTALR